MNVLLCGVGGQGIILASDILAQAMMLSGWDVKKSEIHGMAQRGGSVMSHIRFSDKVYSPTIPKGECDTLVSFEELETARYLEFLKKDSHVIINRYRLSPPSVAIGAEPYPDVEPMVKAKTSHIYFVDGDSAAKALGNPRVVNAYLLGVLSTFLNVDDSVWTQCFNTMLKESIRGINIKAFKAGKDLKVK